jgi:hypothetical protein
MTKAERLDNAAEKSIVMVTTFAPTSGAVYGASIVLSRLDYERGNFPKQEAASTGSGKHPFAEPHELVGGASENRKQSAVSVVPAFPPDGGPQR